MQEKNADTEQFIEKRGERERDGCAILTTELCEYHHHHLGWLSVCNLVSQQSALSYFPIGMKTLFSSLIDRLIREISNEVWCCCERPPTAEKTHFL